MVNVLPQPSLLSGPHQIQTQKQVVRRQLGARSADAPAVSLEFSLPTALPDKGVVRGMVGYSNAHFWCDLSPSASDRDGPLRVHRWGAVCRDEPLASYLFTRVSISSFESHALLHPTVSGNRVHTAAKTFDEVAAIRSCYPSLSDGT